MIRLIYNLFIFLADALIWIPANFNKKLHEGVVGRDKTFELLKTQLDQSDQVIWMHVASLGEFEQGRPVLEALKEEYPDYKILLSFFSPSGYELRKNYKYADVICYLPLDTPTNAKRFLQLAHPDLTIFVKYEFWPNFLKQIRISNSKALLISTVIQAENNLLKYFKSWFCDLMNTFDYILTQDHSTSKLLQSLNLNAVIEVAGDTRIDRTLSIAEGAEELHEINRFCGSDKVLIAGSTWPDDESNIESLLNAEYFEKWKLILAPHDIGTNHVKQIMQRFDGAIKYSQLTSSDQNQKVLVIDNIGLLNKIYRYGHLAYIGGGFGAGIHNTLEPAAFGLPIIFGPKYHKFVEAKQLIAQGGGFSYTTKDQLIEIFLKMQHAPTARKASDAVRSFMDINKGATRKVMRVVGTLLSR